MACQFGNNSIFAQEFQSSWTQKYSREICHHHFILYYNSNQWAHYAVCALRWRFADGVEVKAWEVGLKQTSCIFLKLNDLRQCEEGLREVLTTLDELLADTVFITSKENNQQRIHAACWSFPMWWQDGLWDGSRNPPLQLLWQRRMARWSGCHEDVSAESDTSSPVTK